MLLLSPCSPPFFPVNFSQSSPCPSALGITPDANSCHPAVNSPWEAELQVGPSLAYSQDINPEDTVEVVMEGALAASARGDINVFLDGGKVTKNTDGSIIAQSNMAKRYSRDGQSIDDLALENAAMYEMYKDDPIKTNPKCSTMSRAFSENISEDECDLPDQYRENGNAEHKPEVIGIFSIPQRYSWDKNRSDMELIFSKRRLSANDGGVGKESRFSHRNTDRLDDTVNTCAAENSNALCLAWQSDTIIDSLDQEPRQDSHPQVHKIQPWDIVGDQTETPKTTQSPEHVEKSSMLKKGEIFRAPTAKTCSPTSSIPSPVTTPSIFVFHGQTPDNPQVNFSSSRPQVITNLDDNSAQTAPVDTPDSSEDFVSITTACGSAELSSVVSLDAVMDVPETDLARHGIAYTKGSHPQHDRSSGSDPKSHTYRQCAQTDDEDSVAGSSPDKISKRDVDAIFSLRPSQQRQHQIQESIGASITYQPEDGARNPINKDATDAHERRSDPPTYDEAVMCFPAPDPTGGHSKCSAPGGSTDGKSTADPGISSGIELRGNSRLRNLDPKLIFQHKRGRRDKY